jgi:integrase
MATIVKRKNSDGTVSYQVKVRLLGNKPATETFKRLTDAKRWAGKTEDDIREGRFFKNSEAKKRTLGELIDRYMRDIMPEKKSIESQTQQLEWWKNQLGDRYLIDITPPLLSEMRDKLTTEPIIYRRKVKLEDGTTKIESIEKKRTPATANRYLAVLSHVFTLATNEWQWVDSNPLQKVKKGKEPRGRVRFLTDDERPRLLAACNVSKNRFLYPIVVLALSTGMRQGEILSLTWSDVDLQRKSIVLHDTKNGERRSVSLSGLALELLVKLSKVRRLDTNLLFASKVNGGKTHVDIRTAWEVALRKAEVVDFRFHDLRHSAASYLAMNGATLAEIAEVLGHKTLAMVKRYAHLSEQHTAKVVAAMNEKIFGGQ